MEEFKKELKELILKHKVFLLEFEDYSEDGCCETTIYFSNKNRERFDLSELIEYY